MNKKFFSLLITTLFFLFISPAIFAQLKSIAFYYGHNIPVNELRAFDAAVVEPDQDFDPKKFDTANSQAFAYVSIGEVESTRSFFKDIPKSWFISYNPIWKADIPDQSNPKWRKFFIERVITPLWEKGYRGFFFDTLDSYHLVAKDKRQTQAKGLETLLREIKHKYPQAKFIFNRGFEFLPQLHKMVYAVAAESLYGTWNQTKGTYETVKPEARDYLMKQFKQAKSYGLPVISIDYVAPKNRKKAREIARKIEQDGFIPWVADGHLESLGVGSIEIVPRQILVLYDGQNAPNLPENDAFFFSATPLEYLGYRPVYVNVREPLPQYILNNRYAGIIAWMPDQYAGTAQKLHEWVLKQIKQGMKVLFFGNFGFPMTSKNMETLGIQVSPTITTQGKLRVSLQRPPVGFEVQPQPTGLSLTPLKVKHAKVLLQIKNGSGQKSDVVAYTPWGGYALSPYDVTPLPNNQNRWVLNPFEFIQQALALPKIPVPDTTTLNGRRIMITHIDGDGFQSKSEWRPSRYSGEVIEQEILDKIKIPYTISIIEGEIKAPGIPKPLTKDLEKIARSIFAKPWVEIASHTYSHPYDWRALEKMEKNPNLKVKTIYADYHMPIPGYKFSLRKEITGSVDYINKYLAPPNKRTKVFLWSGDTNPSANAVAMTYKDGLYNMNGGDTTITNTNNSLTNVAPLGVYKGKYFQVFAPETNENIYTNLWRSNFYGFERVIETFKLTNRPRRLKPIDVYYHFYSGTKIASLKALERVYHWALKQQVLNLFVSEFTQIVLDFNHVALAKQGDAWLINTNGYLKELRIPKAMGYPDLNRSKNVIGFSQGINGYYLHLGPQKRSLIYFQTEKPKLPYIVTTNGKVIEFKRKKDEIKFRIKGHLALHFTLANMERCQLKNDQGNINGTQQGSNVTYHLKAQDSNGLTLTCNGS